MRKKKRNAQDSTLININALKKRVHVLEQDNKKLKNAIRKILKALEVLR